MKKWRLIILEAKAHPGCSAEGKKGIKEGRKEGRKQLSVPTDTLLCLIS
jgi:hypothetical protein